MNSCRPVPGSCRQVLGYVYPAYRTYKVVQLPATRANDTLLRKWCCYWCLMAALTAVQPLLDTFLFWVSLSVSVLLVQVQSPVAVEYACCNPRVGVCAAGSLPSVRAPTAGPDVALLSAVCADPILLRGQAGPGGVPLGKR